MYDSTTNGLGNRTVGCRRAMGRLLAACWIAILGGCATYQFGSRSLFRADIQTIHVPPVESQSFRRNLGEALTEALIKEIELSTPYKVANSSEADTVLRGRIVWDGKQVLAENVNDNPRDIDLNLAVEFTWFDQRGNQVIEPVTVPVPALVMATGLGQSFAPEAGQSLVTAQHEALRKLAREIVTQMESAAW